MAQDVYEVNQEIIEEYITYCEKEMECAIVEHLSTLKDETQNSKTKALLQYYIDHYSEYYKICRDCFQSLQPIVAQEPHHEIEGPWQEAYVSHYECSCGRRFGY